MNDQQSDAQYQRMIDTINAMQARYGELVTYRAARGCLAIDMPLALVRKANGQGVDTDIALQTLAGLIVPQVDLTPVNILKAALGSEYTGKRGDCLVLAGMAVKELGA